VVFRGVAFHQGQPTHMAVVGMGHAVRRLPDATSFEWNGKRFACVDERYASPVARRFQRRRK
jgi:hypothetical protein